MLAWLTWFWINFVMTTALICDIWLCHIRIFLWLDSMPCIWDVWLSLALTWLHGSVNCFIAKALTLNREFNFFYLMTSAILSFLHCSSGYCSNCTHARLYSKCCLLCCISAVHHHCSLPLYIMLLHAASPYHLRSCSWWFALALLHKFISICFLCCTCMLLCIALYHWPFHILSDKCLNWCILLRPVLVWYLNLTALARCCYSIYDHCLALC